MITGNPDIGMFYGANAGGLVGVAQAIQSRDNRET